VQSFAGLLVLSGALAFNRAALGAIFFWGGCLRGTPLSLLPGLRRRIGLIRTMVVTPSSFEHSSYPCTAMPSVSLAVLVLLSPFQRSARWMSHQTVLHHGPWSRRKNARPLADLQELPGPPQVTALQTTPCGISVRETFVDQHPIF